MDVISLTEGKVIIGETLVIKRTNELEYINLIEAQKILDKKVIQIHDRTYNIEIPKIISYNGNELVMQRCFGDNLELKLRDKEFHNQYVEYNNFLLKYFLNNKFYWIDFAPRNIMINKDTVYVMDFERGFAPFDISQLEYLRTPNVFEEYSAFLLPNERIFDTEYILNSENEDLIDIYSIGSKRIRTILELLGYKNKAPYNIYLYALRQIIEKETPRIENGEYIFPLIELEDFISAHGHQKYAELILRKEKL